MDIVFSDVRLQRLCEDERAMCRELGRDGARRLKARLADLEAAQVVTDVKRGRPHTLKGNLSGCLALDLHGGYRLLLAPAENPPPQRADGTTDWAQVRRVMLMGIKDYHD
jgi:toxin HigB-1